MMGYLNNCIAGESDAVDAVANCVSAGQGGSGGITEVVLKKNVTAFKFGKIAANNSGFTQPSTVATSDFVNLGIASHERTVLGASYCGTNGSSSCLSALQTALGSASLNDNSTSAQVESLDPFCNEISAF